MISVIIPTHNRARNIDLNLKALELQSLPKDQFEVIVVDDESTDNTTDVVRNYIYNGVLKIKYIRIYKIEAWNASRPRNYGAKMAEKDTEAYLFLDSDVILNRDALAAYAEDFKNNPKRVVIGPYHWTAPMFVTPSDIENRWDDFINGRLDKMVTQGRIGTIGPDIRQISFTEKGHDPSKLYTDVFDALACFGGNLLIPRDLFWKAGGYDEETNCGIEDGDFGLTMWEHDIPFSYDVRALGYHAWHKISDSRFPTNLREQINRLNQKHFGENDPDLGIVNATRETYRKWGIENWSPPPEWEGKDES